MSEDAEEHQNENAPTDIGKIEWIDLTVGEASRMRDFYCSVVGWSSTE